MYKSEFIREVKQHPEKILQPANVRGYVCPFCHSGTGPKGTGLETTSDGEHYTCFSCGEIRNDDVLGIIAKMQSTHSFEETLKEACSIYGVLYDELENDPKGGTMTATRNEAKTPIKEKNDERFKDFINEARKHLGETDYLSKRGISDKTAKKYFVGFCPKWMTPDPTPDKTYYPSPRVIIPTSYGSYLARDTRPQYQDNGGKQKAGEQSSFFNWKCIDNGGCIVIVEGEIDAMSIEEAGGNAIALCSTTRAKDFITSMSKVIQDGDMPPNLAFIVALDNDDSGKKAAKVLTEGLTLLGIPNRNESEKLYNGLKDANVILQQDREALERNLKEAVQSFKALERPEMPEPAPIQEVEPAEDTKEKYFKDYSSEARLDSWMKWSEDPERNKPIPTRFENLDHILDGGLFPGLYVIGATSSAGKTTFLLQVADQIAEQGHDVLIFSLEMSTDELIAKSISRNTAIAGLREPNFTINNALTMRSVSSPAYNDTSRQIKAKAIEYYKEYAKHVFIRESIGGVSAHEIKKQAEEHKLRTGNIPVIIVDYLQILAPMPNTRPTDKQKTDDNVLALKQLSRDLNTPLITVSSFNRTSYKQAVDMTSFKESGSIEYSSDVLLGLQLKGMDTVADGTKNEAEGNRKAKELQDASDRASKSLPVDIQIKILKNRNGARGDSVYFKYYKRFQYFKEDK